MRSFRLLISRGRVRIDFAHAESSVLGVLGSLGRGWVHRRQRHRSRRGMLSIAMP